MLDEIQEKPKNIFVKAYIDVAMFSVPEKHFG